jgi:hypothetical protein
VPDAETEFGVLLALLLIDTVAVRLPVDFGANITFRVADWPAAIVAPPMPLPALNPVPLTLTPDTVTLAVPVFLTATPMVFELPTT